jgi:hypothetical protein
MTHEATDLLKKALVLTEEERAELAGSLLQSLDDTPDDPEVGLCELRTVTSPRHK